MNVSNVRDLIRGASKCGDVRRNSCAVQLKQKLLRHRSRGPVLFSFPKLEYGQICSVPVHRLQWACNFARDPAILTCISINSTPPGRATLPIFTIIIPSRTQARRSPSSQRSRSSNMRSRNSSRTIPGRGGGSGATSTGGTAPRTTRRIDPYRRRRKLRLIACCKSNSASSAINRRPNKRPD